MKKQIMSIAAAAALFTTGAMAFNTNYDGQILSGTDADTGVITIGQYIHDGNNTTAANDLNVTGSRAHGDALIYPYYTQKEGWSTEIYVRNDSDKGMVAKVALYAAKDSEEVKDFNIYLSANDVFRFTIKNNTIELNEDSVVTQAPKIARKAYAEEHSADFVKFGDANPTTIDLNTESGYVVIYGMAQVQSVEGNTLPVHHNHVQMFGQYRRLLDQNRTNWRKGFGVGGGRYFKNGTYLGLAAIQSPSLVSTIETNTTLGQDFVDPVAKTNPYNYIWEDPSSTLTGTVRIMHDTDDNNARDMLLPAIAMENYTDGQLMAWTEGETASLADRRLDDNGSGFADYSAQGLNADSNISVDAQQFIGQGFYYRFDSAAGSVANNLIFTQPLKRVLTQLGNLDGFWDGPTVASIQAADVRADGLNQPHQFVTGQEYQFYTECAFWDEKENAYAAGGSSLITSPYNGQNTDGYIDEIQVLIDDDLQGASLFGGAYDAINGYASCDLGNTDLGISAPPAIVTQMVGTNVNGNAMTNWVHSVIKD